MNTQMRCLYKWAKMSLLATDGQPSAVAMEQNLLDNGQFQENTIGWTLSGNAGFSDEGWNDDSALRLIPQPGITAQAVQRIEGLEPQTRYTIAARVRSTSNLVPPILAVRNGPQIDKATGWIAVGDQGKWIEQRFEIFTDQDQTAVDVTLQAWKTELDAVVMFDDIRFFKGRIEAAGRGSRRVRFSNGTPDHDRTRDRRQHHQQWRSIRFERTWVGSWNRSIDRRYRWTACIQASLDCGHIESQPADPTGVATQ